MSNWFVDKIHTRENHSSVQGSPQLAELILEIKVKSWPCEGFSSPPHTYDMQLHSVVINNTSWHSSTTKTGCMLLWLPRPSMLAKHVKGFFHITQSFPYKQRRRCRSKTRLTNVFCIYIQIALHTASCTHDSLSNISWALRTKVWSAICVNTLTSLNLIKKSLL